MFTKEHAQVPAADNAAPYAAITEAALAANVAEVKKILVQNTYRDQPPAKLVAVTKTVGVSVVNALKPLGVLDIGENRVQVALPKLADLDSQFRLHWIGRLQTNKVKDIIDKVWLLHAMDRLALAEEAERRADQQNVMLDALVQVNIAGETQKAGFTLPEVRPFLRRMKDYHRLRIRGLMAIMPFIDDEAKLAAYFRGMRALFEALEQEGHPNVRMEELSMGMSHDFAIAAREGATMVRVGTALYRER